MKKTVIAMLALVAFAGTALAAGPEVIEFKASMGNVSLPHKMHQEMLKNCKKCHEKGPGKIEGFGKDWAHKNCKGCHAEGFNGKKGPTNCKGCHKK